jgi:DNA-binding XRE family transcriptional regulator
MQHSAKCGENASIKYSAYTVVCSGDSGFCYAVAKIKKYRKILGENVRTYRRNLKWSQEKLAEKSDLHRNYIGDIERGEENVSVDALIRIAAAMKVRLHDLVRDV